MKVFWTPRALADLIAISRFIALDNPRVARQFAAKLKRRAESLRRLPNRGRIVPELGRADIRELVEENYRIAYRVKKSTLEILMITEGHRLLQHEEFGE
jgi:plasmid stabilization system protein ParE